MDLMETLSKAKTALSVAVELPNLLYEAGHLQHMSAHIYVLCGEC